MHEGSRVQDKLGRDPEGKQNKTSLEKEAQEDETFKLVYGLPGHILVNAVEAGLGLISAVAGHVEGEDAQGRGLLRRGSRNLDVLERNKRNKPSIQGMCLNQPKTNKQTNKKYRLKMTLATMSTTTQSKTATQTYSDCTCALCSVTVWQPLPGRSPSPQLSSDPLGSFPFPYLSNWHFVKAEGSLRDIIYSVQPLRWQMYRSQEKSTEHRCAIDKFKMGRLRKKPAAMKAEVGTLRTFTFCKSVNCKLPLS